MKKADRDPTCDERFVGHLLSTLNTGETSGMEATTSYPDNLRATHQVVASEKRQKLTDEYVFPLCGIILGGTLPRTCFCISFVVLLAQYLVANIKESTN